MQISILPSLGVDPPTSRTSPLEQLARLVLLAVYTQNYQDCVSTFQMNSTTRSIYALPAPLFCMFFLALFLDSPWERGYVWFTSLSLYNYLSLTLSARKRN